MSRKLILAAAAVAAVGLAAGGAHANAFQNGGFELGTFVADGNNAQSLSVGDTTMTGWSVAGVGSISRDLNGAFSIVGDEGSYFLDLTGYSDLGAGGWGGVSQTFDTMLGAKYTVTFDLGGDAAYAADGSGVAVTAGSAYSGAFLNTDSTSSVAVWDSESFSFTANGSATTLTFIGDKGQAFVGLDNVKVTVEQPIGGGPNGGVPEPASWALMILGFGGAGAALRRRRSGLVAA